MTPTDTAAPTHTPEGVPLDFKAYEAYQQKLERGETPEAPGKPAAPAAKPAAAAKTPPEPDPAIQQQTAEEEEADAALPPQKKSGFQRRIDGLNQKLGAKDAEIAELKRTQGVKTPPAAAAPAAAAAEAEGLRPGEPDVNDPKFKTYDEYVRALTRFEIAESQRVTAKAETDRTQGEAQKARHDEAKALHEDFDDVIKEAASMPISMVQHQFIVEHPKGQLLAYHFASNPDDTARIHALSATEAAAEIAEILKGLGPAKSKAAAAAEPPEPRVSRTPAPPKTVRAAAEQSGEPDPKDYVKWEAWRSRQPGAALRR